jgi:hypothetical protein
MDRCSIKSQELSVVRGMGMLCGIYMGFLPSARTPIIHTTHHIYLLIIVQTLPNVVRTAQRTEQASIWINGTRAVGQHRL